MTRLTVSNADFLLLSVFLTDHQSHTEPHLLFLAFFFQKICNPKICRLRVMKGNGSVRISKTCLVMSTKLPLFLPSIKKNKGRMFIQMKILYNSLCKKYRMHRKLVSSQFIMQVRDIGSHTAAARQCQRPESAEPFYYRHKFCTDPKIHQYIV